MCKTVLQMMFLSDIKQNPSLAFLQPNYKKKKCKQYFPCFFLGDGSAAADIW